MFQKRSITMIAAWLVAGLSSFAQPPNDSCTNVVPDTLLVGTSILFTGDNTGATATGDAVPGSSMDDGFGKVWHAFVLTSCASVTLNYCGNSPVYNIIYSVLVTTCPSDDPVIFFTLQDDTNCGDSNWTLYFQMLPAGTYYIPVFSGLGLIGPYQVSVSASPCGGGPPNDDCAGGYALTVNDSQDCPANGVIGDNSFGTASAPDPTCLTGVPLVDVWYDFNSGADTALILTAELGTATAVGLEIQEGCGGPVIACGYSPQTVYPLSVTPFTDYVVRVFTALDTANAGTFGLCLQRPPPQCDGAQVITTTQEHEVTVCQDGLPDPIGFTANSTSNENYVFVLCNAGDTILSFLAGDTLDADTLAVGVYHVFGFSFNGYIDDDTIPGYPIAVLFAHGGCYDLSEDSVVVNVEICSGMDEGEDGWSVYPNPSDGDLTIRCPRNRRLVLLELFDLSGRCLHWETTLLGGGEPHHLRQAGHLAPGTYALRVTGPQGSSGARRLLIR